MLQHTNLWLASWRWFPSNDAEPQSLRASVVFHTLNQRKESQPCQHMNTMADDVIHGQCNDDVRQNKCTLLSHVLQTQKHLQSINFFFCDMNGIVKVPGHKVRDYPQWTLWHMYTLQSQIFLGMKTTSGHPRESLSWVPWHEYSCIIVVAATFFMDIVNHTRAPWFTDFWVADFFLIYEHLPVLGPGWEMCTCTSKWNSCGSFANITSFASWAPFANSAKLMVYCVLVCKALVLYLRNTLKEKKIQRWFLLQQRTKCVALTGVEIAVVLHIMNCCFQANYLWLKDYVYVACSPVSNAKSCTFVQLVVLQYLAQLHCDAKLTSY